MLILHDRNSLKYPVDANRELTPRSLVSVLDKGGRYIFNMGVVQFFEMLILNVYLVVYSYQMETELIKDMQTAGKSDPSLQAGGMPSNVSAPYILLHQYAMFQLAYNLGDLLSLSSLQQVTLEYPWVPTTLQFLNFCFWSINIALGFPV